MFRKINEGLWPRDLKGKRFMCIVHSLNLLFISGVMAYHGLLLHPVVIFMLGVMAIYTGAVWRLYFQTKRKLAFLRSWASAKFDLMPVPVVNIVVVTTDPVNFPSTLENSDSNQTENKTSSNAIS